MGDDDMKVEQTSTSTDDAPMESSEGASMAGEGENEDDQTAGETGSISDTAVTGDGGGDEDRSTAPDENEEDNESKSNAPDENDNDDEEESKSEVGSTAPDEEEETKSVETSAKPTNENDTIATTTATPITATTKEVGLASPESASAPPAAVEAVPPPKKKRGKPQIPASARKGRAPAVKGLNIPFRTVKKAMKLDPDIPIVQNEAAIMTTLAAELFLKRLANQSQKICKNRGKNTIRYEDVADARANDPSLAFLKTIIP